MELVLSQMRSGNGYMTSTTFYKNIFHDADPFIFKNSFHDEKSFIFLFIA